MSSKNSRTNPSSSSTPSPQIPQQNATKLPKFLQKQVNRDRSKSVNEPMSSAATAQDAYQTDTAPSPSPSRISRKSGKFIGLGRDKEKDKQAPPLPPQPTTPRTPDSENNNGGDETPVIVEPVAIPRPRTRSERPASDVLPGGSAQTYAGPTSSTSSTNIGGLPTRLSGWFSHTFSSSSTDLTLPHILQQAGRESGYSSASPSPSKGRLGAGSSALLTAAKHGRGHLDKAMRYLLDSDSTPDKCTDPIWLLGVEHPGYEPPPPPLFQPPSGTQSGPPSAYPGIGTLSGHRRRASLDTKRRNGGNKGAVTDTEAILSQSQPPSSPQASRHPAVNWPPVFYQDFTSRIWLTYRSQFPPIKDGRLADLCSGPAPDFTSLSSASIDHSTGYSPTSASTGSSTGKRWHWSNMIGGEKEWSTDTGWGCMLRAGQSLLANSLLHLHLGRDWRVPPYPTRTADYAAYVEIITWFLDTPAPEAPFSVHRMALAGKELGTDVGQWFGPSIAAGAIKALVSAFPEAGLGVSVASDGQCLYQTEVYAASHSGQYHQHRRRYPQSRGGPSSWGDRPVLLLIGTRLGINGVNPTYYNTIKALYTFPQSVGIAGGRPSSSYYFVGSQADNLFYLDPHHARPTVPLRPPPRSASAARGGTSSPESSDREFLRDGRSVRRHGTMKSSSSIGSGGVERRESGHQRAPTSPSSTRTGSSTFSNISYPNSPSPLQHQQLPQHQQQQPQQLRPHVLPAQISRDISSATTASYSTAESSLAPSNRSDLDERDLLPADQREENLDALRDHYATAYSQQELRTFHCDRVRKMPLSGLDPSMLIGFLCRDQSDWEDFRRRVAALPKSIFSVQDEPPKWPNESDDSIGLESLSDPEDSLDMPEDEDSLLNEDDELERLPEGGEEDDDGYEPSDEKEPPRSRRETSQTVRRRGPIGGGHSAHTSSASSASQLGVGEEVDTEEDPVDPITPGPTASRFPINDNDDDDLLSPTRAVKRKEADRFKDPRQNVVVEEDSLLDGDDDWIETPVSPPRSSASPSPHRASPSPPTTMSEPSVPGGTPLPTSQQQQPPPLTARNPARERDKEREKRKKTSKKQVPVPVPSVNLPPAGDQEHYAFPVIPRPADDTGSREGSAERRMHTARARDGGRTQSGGVKGILTSD